jgi:hypothetical protein
VELFGCALAVLDSGQGRMVDLSDGLFLILLLCLAIVSQLIKLDQLFVVVFVCCLHVLGVDLAHKVDRT